MRPTVRSGLVQCRDPITDARVHAVPVHQAMLDEHLPSSERAAPRIFGLQEIFAGPHAARGHS